MKLDRGSLPEGDLSSPDLESSYVEPGSDVGKKVAAIWSEVLGVKQIGWFDNFLELGGDSLRAIQVLSRVREVFKIELPLFTIFANQTVETLTTAIQEALDSGTGLDLPPILRVDKDRPLPLSFPQEAVWVLSQLTEGTRAYNTQLAIRLYGKLDLHTLNRTLTEIVRRHEIFQTIFIETDGRPAQIVLEPWTVSVPIIDLRGVRKEKQEEEAERLIAEAGILPHETCAVDARGWRVPAERKRLQNPPAP